MCSIPSRCRSFRYFRRRSRSGRGPANIVLRRRSYLEQPELKLQSHAVVWGPLGKEQRSDVACLAHGFGGSTTLYVLWSYCIINTTVHLFIAWMNWMTDACFCCCPNGCAPGGREEKGGGRTTPAGGRLLASAQKLRQTARLLSGQITRGKIAVRC